MSKRCTRLIVCLAFFLVFSGVLGAQEIAPVDLYRGSVTVDVIMGRGIGVGIDIPGSGELVGDGTFDRRIVLQAYGEIPKEFPLRLRDAYVAISGGRAVVVDLYGPRVVELVIDRPARRGGLDDGQLPSQILLARAWAGDDETLSFTGNGLTNITVQARVIDDGTWADGPPAARGSCSAGSSSCSVEGCTCPGPVGCPLGTGCSVTCEGDLDACCLCKEGGASCFCTRVEPTGTGGGGGGSGGETCSGGAGGCPAACFACAY